MDLTKYPMDEQECMLDLESCEFNTQMDPKLEERKDMTSYAFAMLFESSFLGKLRKRKTKQGQVDILC